MVNDHLSDFVTRIRNGYKASKKSVVIPDTRSVKSVGKVLQSEGYLEGIKSEDGKLVAMLKYTDKDKPAITGILRVSKPGARIYNGISDLPRVLGGLGMFVLSTPKGIISEKEAKKKNVGGELILKVW